MYWRTQEIKKFNYLLTGLAQIVPSIKLTLAPLQVINLKIAMRSIL